MKTCPFCGFKHNNDNATHCFRCGVQLTTDPVKAYLPAYTYPEINNIVLGMQRDVEQYNAFCRWIPTLYGKKESFTGKPQYETLLQRLLGLPRDLITFIIVSVVNFVKYAVIFTVLLVIFDIVTGFGEPNGVPSDFTLLLLAIFTFVWTILRTLDIVPHLRSLFRGPKRREEDGKAKREFEMEKVDFDRAIKNTINKALIVRKESLVKIPGFKPEYWNECDLTAIATYLVRHMPNCWDEIYQMLETPEQKKKAAEYRKAATHLRYMHEKMGDPVDPKTLTKEQYLKDHMPRCCKK